MVVASSPAFVTRTEECSFPRLPPLHPTQPRLDVDHQAHVLQGGARRGCSGKAPHSRVNTFAYSCAEEATRLGFVNESGERVFPLYLFDDALNAWVEHKLVQRFGPAATRGLRELRISTRHSTLRSSVKKRAREDKGEGTSNGVHTQQAHYDLLAKAFLNAEAQAHARANAHACALARYFSTRTSSLARFRRSCCPDASRPATSATASFRRHTTGPRTRALNMPQGTTQAGLESGSTCTAVNERC